MNKEKLKKLKDPMWFVPRMRIFLKAGGKFSTPLRAGMPKAQTQMLEALHNNNHVLALKSRQLFVTTITMLYLTHRALFWPGRYNVLSITHDGEAVGQCNSMIKTAVAGVPRALWGKLEPDNMKAVGFKSNKSEMRQLMAGGRSQGRSFTFQALHATEMGFWPKGSSAREGMAVDEDVWAAADSTMLDSPYSKTVIESTAFGPSGIFYKMCRIAQESSHWKFLFFPWFDQPEYSMPPPEGWERREDEDKLAELYGLTDAQLCWRRFKIEVKGYGLRRFRQEYPTNAEEPWLVAKGMFYDTDNLNSILASIPPEAHDQREGWNFAEGPDGEYQEGRRYYFGVDPSGGTGRDQAVINIVRDDQVQVGWYASRHTAPWALAEEAAKMAAHFGNAPILVEYNNKFGMACYERLKTLGARLWKNRDKKPWFTDPRTKVKLHDYAKAIVDDGQVIIRDPLLVQEFLRIREQENGNIEADVGYNDDRVMAFILALWNARRAFSKGRERSVREEIKRQRDRRHKEWGLKK